MKLTHFLRAVSAPILLLFVKTSHAQLDYIGHFNNATMGGSAWVKAGTLAIPQAGFSATITFYGGSGFNAQTAQNAQVELNIRTSNGGSLADGAYPVSAVATILGENTGFANIIRLVPNVAGVSPASYDVYFSTGSYIGVGYYRVTSVSGITWTHAMVQATPPAGYNVRLEFRTQTDTWLARNALFASAATGNVGIGTLTPDEKLTVNGVVRAKK
ncbi:hypothetical protein MKQ70_34950 [Chitinophaga sedimenti]|uniref:hypothetical protein n=1 Tax=Chitinophaga sedimenti TaxID=2033606 RepID=UPI00200485E2|nr:hypothetical protein [Chitinophaga sedimenti]MCK7559859.1 hypothetical protein [Chitinophaga sedimenti]